ncbi:hypothetical protein VTN31DRAFT_3500 [Thermomyces dupontii]|uniref:uncharacterized protein n=1 Tax=Talaromyces thermophilus TaxID=28565 RepID=UPI0037432355
MPMSPRRLFKLHRSDLAERKSPKFPKLPQVCGETWGRPHIVGWLDCIGAYLLDGSGVRQGKIEPPSLS